MSNWTAKDVERIRLGKLPAHPPASKYKNVKIVTADGLTFDSKREAAYWQGLLARQAAGEIDGLRRQTPFALLCPSRTLGQSQVVALYISDFDFYDKADDTYHVVDAKGKRTAIYQLKKKWLELQTGVLIEEV